MNERSRAVLVCAGQVALIQRERDGQIYYVFPGGGIEAGETPEVAAHRHLCYCGALHRDSRRNTADLTAAR